MDPLRSTDNGLSSFHPSSQEGFALATRSAMTLLATLDMIATPANPERRRRLRHPIQTWERASKSVHVTLNIRVGELYSSPSSHPARLLNDILEVTKATGPAATKLLVKVRNEWQDFEAYLLVSAQTPFAYHAVSSSRDF